MPTMKLAGRPSFFAIAAAVVGPLGVSGMFVEPALLALLPLAPVAPLEPVAPLAPVAPLEPVTPLEPAEAAGEDDPPQPSASPSVAVTVKVHPKYLMHAC